MAIYNNKDENKYDLKNYNYHTATKMSLSKLNIQNKNNLIQIIILHREKIKHLIDELENKEKIINEINKLSGYQNGYSRNF